MNILKKLTLKNIKLNKKRSIVTIIGIILSTALICTVAGMFKSFQQTIINSIIERSGNYHVNFTVNKDDVKYIKENKNVENIVLYQINGYLEIEKENYVDLLSYSNNYLKEVFKLDSGRLPNNNNEIIIPYNVANNNKYKLNQIIELDLYEKIDKTQKQYDSDGNFNLKLKEKKEYKIVGFINDEYYAYDLITKIDNINDEVIVRAKFNNIKDTFKLTKEIKENLKISDDNIEYNAELLRWSLVIEDDNTIKSLYALVGIIIGIIVLSSVFVIRNSFAISTTEKMKQYGMLASIGSTKKQIRKSVLYEGLILGLIGIPLGILLGFVVIFILIIFSNIMLGSIIKELKFVVHIPLSSIVLSIMLGGLTIYLSSLASAYRASRVSPIEAIRNNKEIKIKSKKIKSPKIINKMFGIGGDIAYKNLKRNKKKYRTTIISLIVSITIFVALSSFIEYGFKLSALQYSDIPYNLIINDNHNNKDKLKNYNEIIKLDNINNSSITRLMSIDINKKYVSDDKSDFFGYNDGYINMHLVSIEEENYKEYLKELGLDYNVVKDKLIYVKNNDYYRNKKLFNAIKLDEGEKLDFKFISNDGNNLDLGISNLEVIKITDKNKFNINQYSYVTGVFLISNHLMEKIGIDYYYVDQLEIDSKDPYKLQKQIEKLDITGLSIDNFEEIKTQTNNMILWISVFLYGFIIVISLIGVTNIFNTITTNMNLRSKEFAMLKSIGMTNKEFNKMIRLESLFYGIKSLFIGCTLGLILAYAIYKSIANSIDFGFKIPYIAIIISIIFISLVIGLIMKYSLSKINKQNIIETIRKDNI